MSRLLLLPLQVAVLVGVLLLSMAEPIAFLALAEVVAVVDGHHWLAVLLSTWALLGCLHVAIAPPFAWPHGVRGGVLVYRCLRKMCR